MIPKNIRREHVLKAIAETKRSGIAERRGSKKFYIEFNGDRYPPKYIISLANKFANDRELHPEEFSGGSESNDFLRTLGFRIVETTTPKTSTRSPFKRQDAPSPVTARHDERCPKCKQTIRSLLEKIHARVDQNCKLEAGTLPEDFCNTPFYDELREIYAALQRHRGFKEFVKAKKLPNCDFLTQNPSFIVEFDESQHFTLPRKITLERYPNDLKLGFSRERWMMLCEKTNARDNNPAYRDEQRAWYDTLRDFLPTAKNLDPTVRLCAGDSKWCSLDPDNVTDVTKFKRIVRKNLEPWNIEVSEEPNPFFSRVIIASEWDGNPTKAKELLETICEKWPEGRKTKFLVTCGGFLQFKWPDSLSRTEIGDNKDPNENTIDTLLAEAADCAKRVLSGGLYNKLRHVTNYITLGIDTQKQRVSTTQNYIGQLHAELVLLIDLRRNRPYWTGKSYPTHSQQKGLVRIPNLHTHFLDLDIGNVMILGCHDLTIFNPRSENAKGWRKQVKKDFKALATLKHPVCVLHHPHTTVKKRTWLNAWNALTKELPSVRHFAGAGRYHESHRDQSEWDTLDAVLRSTKRGNTMDFVVWKN